MGHSARAKFKREIRVQRLSTVTGTEKEQLKRNAVQLALERAAAAPKIPVKSKRPSVSKEVNRTASDVRFDEETIELVKEAMEESVEAARWGVTAPAGLKTRKGKVVKKGKDQARQGSFKMKAAATFEKDSKQRRSQKKIIKAVLTAK